MEDRNSQDPTCCSCLGKCLEPSNDHGNEMTMNENERGNWLMFMNNIRRKFWRRSDFTSQQVGDVELSAAEEETQDELYKEVVR